METGNRETQLPRGKDGKEEVRRLLKAGDFTVEDLKAVIEEQAGIQGETQKATNAVVSSAEGKTTGEKRSTGEEGPPQPKLLRFAEAKEFLKTHGIDLEAKRTQRVKDALRWGEVDKKDADKFGASFDAAEVSEEDIKALIEKLESEPDLKQRIILGVDNATSEQGFSSMIVNAGIRNHIWRRFSEYRRVDPKTGKPLENQRPTGKAGITFLSDTPNLPAGLRGISANNQLTKMKNGTKYLGPNGWMIYFRQCLDEGMKAIFPEVIDNLSPQNYRELIKSAILDPRIDQYLPDTITGTQFPDLRHENDGAVPFLNFHSYPAGRRVALHYYYPADPHAILGGRSALGTFLS